MRHFYYNEASNKTTKCLNKARQSVNEALCDDFNTSGALNELLDLISYVNKGVRQRTSEDSPTKYQNYGALMAVHEIFRIL